MEVGSIKQLFVGRKNVWEEFPPYSWNTEETLVIWFHGGSMAIPSYKIRELMEVKSGANVNIRPGNTDKLAMF